MRCFFEFTLGTSGRIGVDWSVARAAKRTIVMGLAVALALGARAWLAAALFDQHANLHLVASVGVLSHHILITFSFCSTGSGGRRTQHAARD